MTVARINPAWAAVDEPYLESVDGRDFVRLERGGESVELYPGDLIEVGDLIDSGGGGCKVILPGIAEISVSQNTKLQWLGNTSGSPQFNVTEGMIWARVTKTEPAPTATPVPPPDTVVVEKYKFTLKTRAAVLGVRGTEFTVEYRNGSSWFSTFEGEVDVAKDDATLKSGKSVERLLVEDRLSWGVDRTPMRDRFNAQDFRTRLQKAHPSAFRLRHQLRQPIEELKRFQQNLQRAGIGQNKERAQKVRTVLDLDKPQDPSIEQKQKPSNPSSPHEEVPQRETQKEVQKGAKKEGDQNLKKQDVKNEPGSIERFKRHSFSDRSRISRPRRSPPMPSPAAVMPSAPEAPAAPPVEESQSDQPTQALPPDGAPSQPDAEQAPNLPEKQPPLDGEMPPKGQPPQGVKPPPPEGGQPPLVPRRPGRVR